jgi:hypothetical protein
VIAVDAGAAGAGVAAEHHREVAWPSDEDDCDVAKTTIYVANVPTSIPNEAVAQVMGTYGGVARVWRNVEPAAVGAGGDKPIVGVTMTSRDAAETCAAALSGVYKFEESQPHTVRVTWCDPSGERALPAAGGGGGVGEKRKREVEDGAQDGGDALSRQALMCGLPPTATESDLATYFAADGDDAPCKIVFLVPLRAAFLTYATPEAAARAVATHSGTLRPPGTAVPVTLRRASTDITRRPKTRAGGGGDGDGGGLGGPGPGGTWPSVPKPGPQYGEPSPKLYIGSIPAQFEEAHVMAIFSTVGAVKELKILRQHDGRHKGSGFVTYHDVDATERAIHFIDSKYTLLAPNYPAQKPLYMKYAAVGGQGGPRSVGGAGAPRQMPPMMGMGAMPQQMHPAAYGAYPPQPQHNVAAYGQQPAYQAQAAAYGQQPYAQQPAHNVAAYGQQPYAQQPAHNVAAYGQPPTQQPGAAGAGAAAGGGYAQYPGPQQ